MILRAENISRQFTRGKGSSNVFTAVADTQLQLEPGTFTVVTGRSGGGKSTLLNMLSGLLVPTAGKVLIDETKQAQPSEEATQTQAGHSQPSGDAAPTPTDKADEKAAVSGNVIDLYAMEDAALSSFRNQNFGMIPQGQTAIFSLTVKENILLPLTMYNVQKKDPEAFAGAEKYAEELMEKTGITELADVMPSDLSGGEMRRMAIARALIRRPQILFADEPTGDLDDTNTRIVLTILKDQAQQGRTVFLVTHEKETFAYADAVYRMDGGILTRLNEAEQAVTEA